MKTKMTALLAVFVFLACRSNVPTQDIGPNNFPDGEYLLTVKAKMKPTDKTVESSSNLTATTKDGVITLTDELQKKFPIIGAIEKGVFTAKLNDAGGVVHFSGKVEEGIIKGTVKGTSNDKKEIMEGTFTISRKKPETPKK